MILLQIIIVSLFLNHIKTIRTLLEYHNETGKTIQRLLSDPPPPPHPTHTHTHTHVGFYGLRALSIGVMVFILYKLYVLLPYTYPTPKLSPHRRRCISIFPQKTHSVWFISVLNYGDTENVLINHLLLVIPMLYPCHYTNLCPHKPHKHAHTHTHTHTHSNNHTDDLISPQSTVMLVKKLYQHSKM